MTVGLQTAVAHGGRRGARRLVVKSANISNGRIILKMIKNIYIIQKIVVDGLAIVFVTAPVGRKLTNSLLRNGYHFLVCILKFYMTTKGDMSYPFIFFLNFLVL
jgi:hypothetical protein